MRDPAVVGRAVGAAIGADGDLADFVDRKRLLILMDNFEQIVEAAPMVSSLLAETPNAKVLVTSREPLHVDSEQRFAVEPLPETDATILFVERAQAVDPGSRLSRPWQRSAGASTGSRLRSSSPRRASRCSTRTSCSIGSSSASRSSPRGRTARRNGSGL